MQLDFLIFDASDDEAGTCSFDALASAVPARLPTLLREVGAVLAWAVREFGPPSAHEGGGAWDFDLQASGEDEAPLPIAYDADAARVAMSWQPAGRTTIALTLSGSTTFGEAFREAFPHD